MKKEIYSKDAGRDHLKEATESYDSLRDVRNILPVICASETFRTWLLKFCSLTWSFMTREEKKILIISGSMGAQVAHLDAYTHSQIIPLTPTKANYK